MNPWLELVLVAVVAPVLVALAAALGQAVGEAIGERVRRGRDQCECGHRRDEHVAPARPRRDRSICRASCRCRKFATPELPQD